MEAAARSVSEDYSGQPDGAENVDYRKKLIRRHA
jgi:hypothetical protein